VGLYIPGLARRGVAVLRLRGVLGEASACRLAASLRCAFATDPDLLIADVSGLRGWDDSGQRQLADVAAYLAARGGQMALNAMGAHLRRTDPRLAALEVFADVPAVLAAGNAAPWPGRLPRMRRSRPARGELLRHACQRLPSRPGQIPATRQWASAVAGAWDLTGHADAALAGLSELAANAVAYGFGGAAGITMRLWRNADDTRSLTVAVHDSNPAPPVLRAPAAGGQVPRGWGLLIVASCAHAHGWYPGAGAGLPGKTVWLARRIPSPQLRQQHHRAPPSCS
jgi:anti-sigma regulatory factor (Ser/Thr protein kinase)/anti-anti-sigma regulatory factor